jgi:hypothetical protein
MSRNIDWSKLASVRAWTPLQDIRVRSVQVKDTLFRLGQSCYVAALKHNIDFGASNCRRITSLLWAESEGAALRALFMEIEADEAIPGLQIPQEMLLTGGPATYGGILAAVRTGRHGRFLQHADYRIAKDGAFIHRTISGQTFSFHFRGLAEEESERPYAIQRRLEGFVRGGEAKCGNQQ